MASARARASSGQTSRTPFFSSVTLSGPTRSGGAGYTFGVRDPGRHHLGISLKDHSARLRSSFLVTAFFILIAECALLAWPITATAIWSLEAALTWVWFLYLIRILLLFWAIITSTSLAVEKLWGVGTYQWQSFYRVYAAFSPSGSLIGWSSLAFAAGCVLGGLAVIVSASAYSFYDSNLLYGLTLGIGALSVIESFVAPFVLYHFGVRIPVNRARAIEARRMQSAKFS